MISWGASSKRYISYLLHDHLKNRPFPDTSPCSLKAIYLRNVANAKDDKNLLLELGEGEQLDAEDIEKAINDSTIRPVPLYSSLETDSSHPVAAQLYFGPGFEDRLEMEMEESVLWAVVCFVYDACKLRFISTRFFVGWYRERNENDCHQRSSKFGDEKTSYFRSWQKRHLCLMALRTCLVRKLLQRKLRKRALLMVNRKTIVLHPMVIAHVK